MKKLKKKTMRTTLTFLLLCLAGILFAQNTNFYDKEQIGSQYINTICQDKDNFLWIGTKNGLKRFDGASFISYYHDDKDSLSLSNNEIHSLVVDDKQNLWVGTASGLQRYCPESDNFRTVVFQNMYMSRRVAHIIQCAEGELLCNVQGMGIFRFDADSMIAVPEEKKAYSPYISSMFEDSRQRLWLGTSRGTIVRINPATKEEKSYSLPFFEVKNILEGADGMIYAVFLDKVVAYDEQADRFYELPYHGTKKAISFWTASLTANGDIVLGTYGQGLLRIKRGERSISDIGTVYSSFVNTDRMKAKSLFEDKERNLWIGCDFQGMLMIPYRALPFQFWNLPITYDDAAGHVNVLFCDKENTLWCAIWDNGVYQLDSNGHVLRHIDTPSSVSSIFEDSKGNFWLGVDRMGLYLLDRKSGKLTLKLPVRGGFSIRHIEEDHRENLYVSVLGKGVLRHSLATGETTMLADDPEIKDKPRYFNNWPIYTLCDSEERIWFGYFGDINCYDMRQNRFLELSIEPGIKFGFCYAIVEGEDHTVWLATGKGLVHYNPETGTYSVLTKEQGLPENMICGLVKDKHGNLWCSTTNGICHVNLSARKITNYYVGNGLQDKVYLEGRCTVDGNGRIYFAGEKGITGFNPDDIRQVGLKNTPVITDMLLGDRKVNMQTLSDGRPVIGEELVYAEEFRLSYKDNTFTFFVSQMDYRDPGSMSYEYRLEEFGDGWSSTLPGENRIQYHHLQPGNYTLQIRASENGVYSPVRSVKISIAPPWYLSLFAKIVYTLLVIGAGYLLFLSYSRKRKEEIGEMKLQFFINIAHEIRSPLTLIAGPLSKLLKKEYDPDTQRALLGIKHNTDRILNLINQLLDIRKIDKGQMNLRFAKTDMKTFAGDVVGLFTEQAAQKNIQLSADIPEELPEVWVDPNNFDKILVNLLSNALKYTPQGGRIDVSISTGEDTKETGALRHYMEISVSDTGKGLNEKELKKIFERFYQGEANHTSTTLGFGIGLNLCQLLVRLHHGSISAYNRQDTKGSRFVVRLPLGCGHLKKEEMQTEEVQPVHNVMTEDFPACRAENGKTGKSKTGYHVLVIDDDEELRNYLKENLSVYYHVDTAMDGTEGWKKAITQQPDLIVSDIVMPGMDGIQLLKELKKNINTNHIPVILLTSQTEFANRIEGLSQGADGYLGKPFDMDELIVLAGNLITNRVRLKGKYSGSQTQEEKVTSIELQGNDNALMERIMKVVNANLNNPEFSVEMLAQEVGLSRTHLHRKMKEMTGLSTSDFIRNLRLRQAADLLKSGQSTVTQIAYAVGFSNQAHFSSAFKKVYGMTPKEYMESAGTNDKDL